MESRNYELHMRTLFCLNIKRKVFLLEFNNHYNISNLGYFFLSYLIRQNILT